MEIFTRLADATRVRIILALRDEELSVNHLADLLDKTPASVSQHLAKLRLARMVLTRQDGTRVFYSLADEHASHHDHGHSHPSGIKGFFYGLFVPHSHDALEASQAGVRAVKISLVVLGVSAALQIGVFAISGSVALLADTIHNFSDALTAIPLWIALVVAAGPPPSATPTDWAGSRISLVSSSC